MATTTTPTCTIMITLSVAAQRAALIAGEPAAAEQTYPVEGAELIARLLALPWTVVHPSGNASCTVPPQLTWSEHDEGQPLGTPLRVNFGSSSWHREEVSADVRPMDGAAAIAYAEGVYPSVMTALDARRATRIAEDARREEATRAAVDRWCAFPLAERASSSGPRTCLTYPDGPGLDHSGTPLVDWRAVERLAPAVAAETTAECARLAEAVEAAKAAVEADREAAARELVSRYGDDSQRARQAEGLLPADEIVSLVRSVALGPIDLPRYQRIELLADDDADDDVCETHLARTEVSEVDGALDAEAYARLVQVRTAIEAALPGLRDRLPGAIVTQIRREHHVWCSRGSCSADHTREGLLVTVSWRGIEASREYAL